MELSNLDMALGSSAFTAIGILIGNRLALGREKRKEFNEMVNPLYANIRNQMEKKASFVKIESDQWHIIERYIPWYKRRFFSRCIKRYEDSTKMLVKYDPKTGIYTHKKARVEVHINASKKLLKYLEPR